MNKKIFKRLLIATSMIAPIAIVSPMILTSCNDNKNSTTPGDDSKLISLGNFNKLLKTKDINGSKSFWLNVFDFHGNGYGDLVDDEGNKVESQIQSFYKSLVSNKDGAIKELIKDGFKVSESDPVLNGNEQKDYYPTNSITLTKNKYENSDKDIKNLSTIFKGLHLTNIVDEYSFDIVPPSGNNTGIMTNWNTLDFAELLKKTTVESKIIITDKKLEYSNAADANVSNELSKIRSSSEYYVEYKFTPKKDDGYSWKGISGDDKYLPLVVRLKDMIDNIEIVKDLNTLNLNNNGDSIELNGKLAIDDTTLTDAQKITEKIKTELGLVKLENNVDLLDDKSYTNAGDKFKFINWINTFEKNAGQTDHQWSTLNVENTKNAANKNRITAKIINHTQNTSSTPQSVELKIELSLNPIIINSTTYSEFEWFTNFVHDSSKKPTAKIVYNLNISKKA